MIEQYLTDLLKLINRPKAMMTESTIHGKMYDKYGFYTTMWFNDAIRTLEFEGQVIKMNRGGVVWWEAVK